MIALILSENGLDTVWATNQGTDETDEQFVNSIRVTFNRGQQIQFINQKVDMDLSVHHQWFN